MEQTDTASMPCRSGAGLCHRSAVKPRVAWPGGFSSIAGSVTIVPKSLNLRNRTMSGKGEGSITGWIAGMKAGDLAAAQPLWERYFARMVILARGRLRTSGRRGRDAGSDEEDAALSAFDSLCVGLIRGQFPQLADRDDLWRLLVVITTRKVRSQTRRQLRQKRGGGKVQPACDVDEPDSDDALLVRAVGSEPTPEFAAMVT